MAELSIFTHAAILAEAFGIPILQVPALRELMKYAQATVVLNAEGPGMLLIEPTESEIELRNDCRSRRYALFCDASRRDGLLLLQNLYEAV